MKKNLEIKIADQGEVIGTVGWLCKNADHIKIGATKSGNQAAWLKNAYGETIVFLASRNINYMPEGGVFFYINDLSHPEISAADFILSDACWARIKEIQAEIEPIMDKIWEEDSQDNMVLIQK
jgi:hypothetical protein